jgi:hypothetical protein
MEYKARKTYLKYIGELANRGFINGEEFNKIIEKINNWYDSRGLK